MYEPFEEQLRFPEQPDPDAHWADVWKDAFVCSDEALMKGENGVPVAFGVKVLKFAEMAAQSHSQNGGVVAKA